MNTETWEQIALQEEAITNADLLMEGVNVDVLVLSEDETISPVSYLRVLLKK